MKLDNKIVGELCFKLGSSLPEAEISVKKVAEIDGLDVDESQGEDTIVCIREGEDEFFMDLTEIEEGVDTLEELITYIAYVYSNNVTMTVAGHDRLEEDMSDYDKISDKIFAYVVQESLLTDEAKEMYYTKKVRGTDLVAIPMLNVRDYCKKQAEPEHWTMLIPSTLINAWGVPADDIFEKAAENTGKCAIATDISYLINTPLTDEEKARIDETLEEIRIKNLVLEQEEKEIEEEEEDPDDWDAYESDWDVKEPVKEAVNEKGEVDPDVYTLDGHLYALHTVNGMFGASALISRRFLIDMCNKEEISAAYIVIYNENDCMFVPDLGYTGTDLHEQFIKDILDRIEEDDTEFVTENIYRFSLANGLETIR